MFRGLLQPSHLLIILVLCMLIFPRRLAEFGKVLGEGVRAFKDVTKEKPGEDPNKPKS